MTAQVLAGDPYKGRAAEVFGVQPAGITEQQRRYIKTMLFAERYGAVWPGRVPPSPLQPSNRPKP